MAPLRSARRPSASTSYGHISAESIREYTTEQDNTLTPVGKLMLTYLEPTKIDVVVGGVQVGGIIPWLQTFLVQRRTLSFTVYFVDKDKKIVIGDAQALTKRGNGAIWLESSEPQDKIISQLAYALLQKRLAEDPNNQVEVLNVTEFEGLVTSLNQVAKLNRHVARGGAIQQMELQSVLDKLEPVATKASWWPELNYLPRRSPKEPTRMIRPSPSIRLLRKLPVRSRSGLLG
jgi:hypothetical protein